MNNDKKSIVLVTTLTSAIVTLTIIGLVALVAIENRAFIGDYFSGTRVEPSDWPTRTDGATGPSRENQIITAVEEASPAVFSIIVSREVPVSDFDPFGGFFGFRSAPRGTQEREVGGGSGFFITADGLAVTNSHVVDDPEATYEVVTSNGKRHVAEVVDRDPFFDIAVIQVEGTNFPTLPLGNSEDIRVGQTVIAIGNALGEFENTVSVGVISGLSRSVVASDPFGQSELLDEVIQTDAAINPGNSGGPLLNLDGEVIGVNVAVARGSENIGFALPITLVRPAIESVRNDGEIIRPFLGVRYLAITPALAARNNLPVDYGALVIRGETPSDLAVQPGSPANRAGIVENDIILEIDGEKITPERSLASIIRRKKVGQTVALKIIHRGDETTARATLVAAPE